MCIWVSRTSSPTCSLQRRSTLRLSSTSFTIRLSSRISIRSEAKTHRQLSEILAQSCTLAYNQPLQDFQHIAMVRGSLQDECLCVFQRRAKKSDTCFEVFLSGVRSAEGQVRPRTLQPCIASNGNDRQKVLFLLGCTSCLSLLP